MKRTTKKQRKARVKKLSANRRIANALRKFVRSNPAVPVSMRKAKALGLRRNKGGSVTIRVIKVKDSKR
jgi:hypothetical protein